MLKRPQYGLLNVLVSGRCDHSAETLLSPPLPFWVSLVFRLATALGFRYLAKAAWFSGIPCSEISCAKLSVLSLKDVGQTSPLDTPSA